MRLFLLLCCCCAAGATPLLGAKRIPECTVAPCQLDDDSLRFFVIGDWGGQHKGDHQGTPTENQIDVARQMAQIATAKKTQFQVSVGDNFYNKGPQDVNDPRFKMTFEDVYSDKSLQTPWYISLGNHDYYGKPQVQIDYTQKNPIWNLPNFYYKFDYKLKTNTLVRFVVIDTVMLAGNTDKNTTAKGAYPEDWDSPMEPDDKAAAEAQWKWIEETLSDPVSRSADYLFVVGHYPLYCAAEHQQTVPLVNRLEPLLHKYRVQAYLHGHSHTLEYITREVGGYTVHHILSGAGGTLEGVKTFIERGVGPASLQFIHPPKGSVHAAEDIDGHTKKGGFVYMEVNKDSAKIEFHQSAQGLLFSVPQIPNRNSATARVSVAASNPVVDVAAGGQVDLKNFDEFGLPNEEFPSTGKTAPNSN